MLFERFYVADRRNLTVWRCACAADMRPIERRLWMQFWPLLEDIKRRGAEALSGP